MIEYFTPDNVQAAGAVVLVILGFVAPQFYAQAKVAERALVEIAELVQNDAQPNAEFYKKAKEQGLHNLADQINKRVEAHIDYSKVV